MCQSHGDWTVDANLRRIGAVPVTPVMSHRRRPHHHRNGTGGAQRPSVVAKTRRSTQDGAMLRIHFTVADVAKVRVVVLGPLAELQLSFTKLHPPRNQALFGRWHARTVADAGKLTPDTREVAQFLAPPAFGLVDLFTLVGPVNDWAEGFDRLCGVPTGPLRAEFGFAPRVAPGWIGDFVGGDRA